MHSFLITGGTPDQQIDKVNDILQSNFQFSIFNFQFPSPNPDVFLTDPFSTSIGIEDIRHIITFCSLKPYQSTYKVVVISSAQLLTVEAQNALLKTLEEPPAQCLIFLLVSNKGSLLPTVVSRCQIVELPPVGLVQLTPEKKELYVNLLDQIIHKPYGHVFELISQNSPDKASAILFCQSLITALEPLLHINSQALQGVSLIAQFIRILQKTIIFLDANTNVRLTMDNLVLNLRNSAKTS